MRTLRFVALLALMWVGCVVALLVALRLTGLVGFVAGLSMLGAWTAHTLESSVCRDDLLLALQRCGMAEKEAAIHQGITPQQFSNQLAGDEMVSLWRLASLPAAFWVEFATLRLERFSAGIVITSQEVIALVQSVRELTAEQQQAQPVRNREAA